MWLEIENKDKIGNINTKKENISNLILTKHMAIAGQGYLPTPAKFLRCIGRFLSYSNYFGTSTSCCFRTPTGYEYDPTEKNQFSNLAGKAIADYLAKQISGAKITYNYEAAMKINKYSIKGSRPDLLCDTGKEMFAVEAKGYTKKSISKNEMNQHKVQSKKGPIPVGFSIASVSYDMYKQIKVKYHDPVNENYKYDYDLSKKLALNYYSNILKYIKAELFKIHEIEIDGLEYYKIDLMRNKMLNDKVLCICCPRISILLDKRIKGVVQGNIEHTEIFNREIYVGENVYIDTDGIGIMI